MDVLQNGATITGAYHACLISKLVEAIKEKRSGKMLQDVLPK